MRSQKRYYPFVLAASLMAATASADAGDAIPDTWRPYSFKHLEMKPGYKMHHDGRWTVIVKRPGNESHLLRMENAGTASVSFAEIRSAEQARELCELLIHGAIVEDAESFKRLVKVHRDAGCENTVDDKELAFKQIAKPVEGGFQVELTAFHEPQTMGAQSVVARFEFFVGKDAAVRIKSKTYLKGVYLNWQTLALETTEAREREARAQRRVADCLKECYKHCSTRLPRIPEDNRGA